MSAPKAMNSVDLAIVGGGIAGLWLANLFADRGYQIVLLEGNALGSGQTLASQGMIHGGVKYSLGGAMSSATHAISAMPARWRDNLAGRGELDLHSLTPLSERYYLFAEDSTLDKLASFFASRALRGRIKKLNRADYPSAFNDRNFAGVVYAVDDLVIDTEALLRLLHGRIADRAYSHLLTAAEAKVSPEHVALQLGNAEVHARHLLLCAGTGNEALLQGLGLPEPRMQRRPLHQVMVRHEYPHPVYAHCLTGIRRAEPRMTITSHHTQRGPLWYLGGQLASDGVALSADELTTHARQELEHCVPWVRWDSAEFTTLRIDRAEPLDPRGQRPDRAFAAAHGPVVVCWPTKLSLMPDLGDRVQALVGPALSDDAKTTRPTLDLPAAQLGQSPWAS
jgi:glycine/D-amino acid oxidase-like deaminating enzyme